jgi:two-component system response regulator RegA
MSRFLVIDDDPAFRSTLARGLTARGHSVLTAAGLDDAMHAMQQPDRPDLVVVDLHIGGEWGLEVLQQLRSVDARPRFVILTGYGAIHDAVEAMRLGATDFLGKPVSLDALEALAHGLLPAAGKHDAPSLARIEWEHIHRVLADCGGNVSKAAKSLGIHRRSLQRKLRKTPPPR